MGPGEERDQGQHAAPPGWKLGATCHGGRLPWQALEQRGEGSCGPSGFWHSPSGDWEISDISPSCSFQTMEYVCRQDSFPRWVLPTGLSPRAALLVLYLFACS